MLPRFSIASTNPSPRQLRESSVEVEEDLVTKSDLRCFVALAGILPVIRYVRIYVRCLAKMFWPYKNGYRTS